jgi:sulfoacetaldehyde dehydrogenase
MRQADLIVATGGAGWCTRRTAPAPRPAGSGWATPYVVDETADLADAASAIVTAKTFDTPPVAWPTTR